MTIRRAMGALVLLAAPLTVLAQSNQLDLYYIDAHVEARTPGFGRFKENGDGYGVKGVFTVAEGVFLAGEYQKSTYDDTDNELEWIRGGIGFAFASDPMMSWFGLAEAIRLNADNASGSDSESGYGLHVGARFDFSRVFSLGARVGYVDLDESNGVEWLVDAAFALSPGLSLFADYRLSSLEDDANNEIDLDDLRLGLRLLF
ncbi:outer membrane beta-barrel protein [Fontimonas sp. SYSU GA230001]|uniref:outer membrane beta-barrel protein n=1 Tax=Fontimonas sp. SYSU GA230001 TaxID=3142450 RepID=UPI0032B366D9